MVQHDFFVGPNARLLAAGQHSRQPRGRFGNALSVSALAHAIGGLCLLIVAGQLSSHDTVAKLLQDAPRLAWIADSASGGRGQNDPKPSQQLARPGHDIVTIPTSARTDSRTLEDATTPRSLDVPVVSATSGIQELPGVITGLAVTPGGGEGSGIHPGSGQGPGSGPGFGPGNGGLGDGYTVGNGVSAPRLIREVKPGYTSDAMRARIQGLVRLQAIVLPDGSIGNARVVRSLDDRFGLDEEAVKAVKQWRFEPARREGRAVPVIVEIELSFALR
jgi:TonB family protein